MHSHDRMFVYVVVCTHVGKTFLHFFSLLSNLCLQVYFKNLQNVSLSKLVFFGGDKGKRRSEKKKRGEEAGRGQGPGKQAAGAGASWCFISFSQSQ